MTLKNKLNLSAVISAVLPVIYVILSFINIYSTDMSTAVFHETYDLWKDITYFDRLHPVQTESYIYSVVFILPYIVVCIIGIFPEKLKGKKKLLYSAIGFLIFLFINYISMDEVHQTTCSDDFMMIGLVSELQNIFIWLNIISFLLVCCTAVVEIRTAGRLKNHIRSKEK